MLFLLKPDLIQELPGCVPHSMATAVQALRRLESRDRLVVCGLAIYNLYFTIQQFPPRTRLQLVTVLVVVELLHLHEFFLPAALAGKFILQ